MTISQERSALAGAAGRAEFATAGARGPRGCPWIVAGEIARPDGGREWLYLIAEPTEPTGRGALGAKFVGAIRDVYAASNHDDPIVALTAAIEAANDALYNSNRSAAPGLRLFLGLTCLVVRGADLIICQVPPTQLILAQNGSPVLLPELDSWRPDYQPHTPGDRQGVGATETATPLLYRAVLEEGDLITLCSTNLARLLAAEGEDALEPLLGSDPERAADALRELAERNGLDPAFGVVIAPPIAATDAPASGMQWADDDAPHTASASDDPGEAHGERWIERSLREMRDWSRIIPWRRRGGGRIVPLRPTQRAADPDDDGWGDAAIAAPPAWRTDDGDEPTGPRPVATEYDAEDEPWDRQADSFDDDDREDAPVPTDHAARYQGYAEEEDDEDEPRPTRPTARGRTAGRAAARRRGGVGQALGSLVAFFVLVVGSALERLLPAGGRRRNERFLERSRSRVWPIGNLERHATRGPRLGRAVPLIALAALLIAVTVLTLSVRNRQTSAERARFDNALAQVAQAREAALASPDKLAAYTQLLALPGRLDAIGGADKPGRPERIAAERASLAVALDKVAGVERLPAGVIQTVARPPAQAGAAVGRPQLVARNGQQFALLNGTVYSIDAKTQAFARILGKGDNVGGVSVGQVLGIVWRVDALFAFTETHGFVRNGTGWSSLPLAATGHKAAAVESFDGNLYFLEPERGQIVKFASGAYAQTAQPWTSGKGTTDLAMALDFAIDKDIYILLSDGRILDYYQGELKTSFAPGTVPPLAGASLLAVAPDGRWLYLLDPKEGRIVRLGRDGAVGGVYKPADGGDKTFASVRDLAVDETTGTLYLLTDEGIVGVRLP